MCKNIVRRLPFVNLIYLSFSYFLFHLLIFHISFPLFSIKFVKFAYKIPVSVPNFTFSLSVLNCTMFVTKITEHLAEGENCGKKV